MNTTKKDSVLIIGAGVVGRAIAWDLQRALPNLKLIIVDTDPNALKAVAEETDPQRVEIIKEKVENKDKIARLMDRALVSVGATSYTHHYTNASLAIEHGSHWVDLGGNSQVVDLQMSLHSQALQNGLAIVPDTGLAPGMTNLMVAHITSSLDSVEEIFIRVGGLPQIPRGPLFYNLLFSPEGLINEYREPCKVIENGVVKEVEPLTGWERVYVGPPLGTLEACNTSGGSSTLPVTYLGKVKTLNYKTLRYPGHFRRIKLLKDLGLFDEEPIDVGTLKISPRKFTERILLKRLGWADQDLVVAKVSAIGMKNGVYMEKTGFLYYETKQNHRFSAMAQTTGFSSAIVVQLLIDGGIKERGTLFQELHIPSSLFFDELEKREIKIEWSERTFPK